MKKILTFLVVALLALGVTLVVQNADPSRIDQEKPEAVKEQDVQDTIGSQQRKRIDIDDTKSIETENEKVNDSGETITSLRTVGYDSRKPITALNHPHIVLLNDPNPRTRSVLEAKQTGRYPERLSVYYPPTEFDEQKWAKDESWYIDVVEPGRVDKPGPLSAPELQSLSPLALRVPLITEIPLKVQALPGAPVSFVTTRGGIFVESKVNAVTVKADADGVATVHYYAPPGIVRGTEVLAASPLCSGQVSIHLNVIDDTRAPDPGFTRKLTSSNKEEQR